MSSSLCAFCDFGERVTQEFGKIEIEFYQLPWYLLSMDMQKKLPFVIAITQKEVVIKGFGSTSCNRENFTQVRSSTGQTTNFQHFFLNHFIFFTLCGIFFRIPDFSDYHIVFYGVEEVWLKSKRMWCAFLGKYCFLFTYFSRFFFKHLNFSAIVQLRFSNSALDSSNEF